MASSMFKGGWKERHALPGERVDRRREKERSMLCASAGVRLWPSTASQFMSEGARPFRIERQRAGGREWE